MCAVLAGGLAKLRYDHNLLNLQADGLESVELERKLLNECSQSMWYAVSIADSREVLLARKERLLQTASVERTEEIVSLLPDGSVHWTHPWQAGAIAMPVFVPPNRILVSASADVGATLLEVGKGGDGKPAVTEVWTTRQLKNHFSSSVHVDGTIYGFDMGTLRAIDAATGESKWAHRGLGTGSLIAAGGLLYVLSDRGRLVLVEEIADTIAFMTSEECSFTTGFTFDISGGRATY